jgi:hypothetical protein
VPNDPILASNPNRQRQIIICCLGVLAAFCLAWIVYLKLSVPEGPERPLALSILLAMPFSILDVLVLVGLGIWILRPPAPGVVGLLGRLAAKVALFLLLGLATVVLLFFTCGMLAGSS